MTLRTATDMTLPPLVAPGPDLTRADLERYSRQLILPEIGRTGQRRLKNARVLVIGAGGLGAPVLLYLAAAGVGTLGIVDDDVVEISNLQRQIIHGVADVGRPKVESARDAVAEINPLVSVELHPLRLDSTNALELFAQYDLIVDGADNFATRYLVNDAAALLGKPYVWGSILRFDGQVSVFWDTHGPTYRDLYPEAPPVGSVPSCAGGGVFGMLCAAVGSIMVTEAVKLITGIGRTLLGRLQIFNALDSTWREIRIIQDPETEPITHLTDYQLFCGMPTGSASAQGGAAPTEAMSVQELHGLLQARDAGTLDFELIDVREPGEHALVCIPGSSLTPRAEIETGRALDALPRDKDLVLYCKSGVRSAQAIETLKRAGYTRLRHVTGGVLAWVNEIEPDKPVY